MRIAAVVGNPRPGGRTTAAATAVAERVASAVGGADAVIVELAGHASSLFDWPHPALDELTAMVATSEAVVVASPTYKASFTGLLKAFLDRYGSDGLAGVVAVPVMLGAGPRHALAPETQLRPVLVELGATVPGRALYVVDSEMDDLASAIDGWWEQAGRPILRALGRP